MGMSKRHSSAETKTTQEKPLDFYQLLRKENRLEGPYMGNRNPWMASQMYFAMIAKQPALVEWVVKSALGNGKSEREVEKTRARTHRVVGKRRQQCLAYAISRCAGLGLRHNGVRVFAQMALYGWHTGYCCAAQASIGKALGLSRQTVHKWVKRLQKAGVIQLVSYDARGGFQWRGRTYIKWCLVFDTGLRWGSEKVDTNPMSALVVCGQSVRISAFSGEHQPTRDASADFSSDQARAKVLCPRFMVDGGA